MDLQLKNKVALVAASSQGLGKAIAWGMAREGAKLVICARQKETLEKTADDIFLDTGVTVFPLAVDLTEKQQIDWLMSEILDMFGKIDILVTNAGGPPPGSFLDLHEEDWMKTFHLTLMSAVRLTRAVLPKMREQKWGRIIHIASVSAKQPIPNLHLSNVMRPGILGFTKSLALELAKDNILVNAVCPGYMLTERVQDVLLSSAKKHKKSVEEVNKELVTEIPLGRIGKPEELANLVVFLASEKASYITGSLIQVDGGYIKGVM